MHVYVGAFVCVCVCLHVWECSCMGVCVSVGMISVCGI